MRLLKAFVIGMGVVIPLGFIVLIWGVLRGVSVPPSPVASVNRPAETGPYNVEIPPPAGMRLRQMLSAGGHMLLRFEGTGGAEGARILVVDPGTGRVIGNIIVPATAPVPEPGK